MDTTWCNGCGTPLDDPDDSAVIDLVGEQNLVEFDQDENAAVYIRCSCGRRYLMPVLCSACGASRNQADRAGGSCLCWCELDEVEAA